MAIPYIDLPQCEPTNREEITTLLTDVSENGVIRARVMHDQPTYRLSLSHTALTMDKFAQWEAWWRSSFNKEVEVTWVVDGESYVGVFQQPPRIEYEPWQRVSVFVVLLVKHA